MTTPLKHPARPVSLLLCATLLGTGAQAQNTERPDLEGVWTNGSLTNLTRFSGMESLVVSAEEARAIADSLPTGGVEGGFDDGDGVNNLPAVFIFLLLVLSSSASSRLAVTSVLACTTSRLLYDA